MTTSLELMGLLRQIRGAGSTLQKLKSAALAWRTLRGLAPDERLQIARELGLEGAELIVEGLGQRGGLSPSDLLGAIRAAEQADDTQLSELLTALKDPSQRAQIAKRAAQTAEQWAISELAENHGSEHHAATGSPDDESADDPFSIGDDESTATGGTAGPSVQELVASDVFPTPPRPSPTPRSTQKPPAHRPTTGSSTAVATVPRQPTVSGRPTAATTARTAPRPSELAAELRTVPSVIRRLRRLSASLRTPPQLSTEQWAEVAACFAAGWPRRRALAQIFRASCPDDIHVAIALMEELAETGDRLWLLAALADRPDLRPSHQLRLLEAAAASPALERRLRRRLRTRPAT